jgi:hypothetical protein
VEIFRTFSPCTEATERNPTDRHVHFPCAVMLIPFQLSSHSVHPVVDSDNLSIERDMLGCLT